jgi:hypothetical protein
MPHILQMHMDSVDKNKSACVHDIALIHTINDVLSGGAPVVDELVDNNTSLNSNLVETSESTNDITSSSFEPSQSPFKKSHSPQATGEHSAKVRTPCEKGS